MSELNIAPDHVIKTVQEARLRLLTNPDDPSGERLMLLRDLAKTAVDQTRLQLEEEGLKAENEMACIMATLIQKSSNPFVAANAVERVIEAEKLPEIEPVEGEMDREMSTLRYEDLYGEEEK